MKQTLVIGSTVVDIIVQVPRIPATGEDVNIVSQHMQLGGCAYNVSHILRLTGTPHILCSPVGSGIYGDYVAARLADAGIPCFIRLDNIPNGCCYCLVEDGGERSFMSCHGAEYLFQKNWMTRIDCNNADSVYICGLEIEEPTGVEIISFLEEHTELTVFFAPGPRIQYLPAEHLERLFRLKPVLHLNREEACSFTGCSDPADAARRLYRKTGNMLVVTLGKEGALVLQDGRVCHVPGFPAEVTDTIGAGDSHIGALIAYIKQGFPLEQAAERANRLAAAVVATKGAILSPEDFKTVIRSFEVV